jgi:UPF0271 protein
MDFVSSANIACGFHAGDASVMRRAVDIAIKKGVAIGAHPGYPDREGFGRRNLILPLNEVYDIVVQQIAALQDIALAAGGKLTHVKPHGALYNEAAKNAALARTISSAIRSFNSDLCVYALSGSVLIEEAARCGLRTASEVFADRTYRSDGTLTGRSEPDALINTTSESVAQVLEMVCERRLTSIDGKKVAVKAETVCVHGDNPVALDLASSIYRALGENGIEVRAL